MGHYIDEDELVEIHTQNQQNFEEADNELRHMRQTIVYQETELTEKLNQLCDNCPAETLQRLKQQIRDNAEAFKQQLSDKEDMLAQAKANEEQYYQKLSDLLDLL